jgi:formylglycine-generating enzyme required for sulfatase activity
VINVSWDDAKAYVGWLSKKTGKTYRLPSEVEREYVARAGTTTPFWWGTTISTAQANYDGNYKYPMPKGLTKGEYREQTMPVDSFKPNPWGLYNVHGNVWEWTEDCWNVTNAGNPRDGRARTSGDCSLRIIRSGSLASPPQYLRSAFRERFYTDKRNHNGLGFRLARTLNP